jgi:hypothetical protein
MRWSRSLPEHDDGPRPRTGRWARSRSQGSLLGLCYASRASRRLDGADLLPLVRDARAYNVAHEITGCLLYGAGYVIQVLEGPPRHVLELFRRIRADRRHVDVHTVCAGPVHGRAFEGSPLEFHDLDLGPYAACESLRDELSVLYFAPEGELAEVLELVEGVRALCTGAEAAPALA